MSSPGMSLKHPLPGRIVHEPYMIGRLASNSNKSNRTLVTSVPPRVFFRASTADWLPPPPSPFR